MHALQFVADGVLYAELNEVLTRELAEDGYSCVEVRVTPTKTEITSSELHVPRMSSVCTFFLASLVFPMRNFE